MPLPQKKIFVPHFSIFLVLIILEWPHFFSLSLFISISFCHFSKIACSMRMMYHGCIRGIVETEKYTSFFRFSPTSRISFRPQQKYIINILTFVLNDTRSYFLFTLSGKLCSASFSSIFVFSNVNSVE